MTVVIEKRLSGHYQDPLISKTSLFFIFILMVVRKYKILLYVLPGVGWEWDLELQNS